MAYPVTWKINVHVDLSNPNSAVIFPNTLMRTGDSYAHTVVVHVFDNRKPANLSSIQSATATFVTSGNTTGTIQGVVSGNTIEVSLPNQFYIYSGQTKLSILVKTFYSTMTIVDMIFFVHDKLSTSSNPITPPPSQEEPDDPGDTGGGDSGGGSGSGVNLNLQITDQPVGETVTANNPVDWSTYVECNNGYVTVEWIKQTGDGNVVVRSSNTTGSALHTYSFTATEDDSAWYNVRASARAISDSSVTKTVTGTPFRLDVEAAVDTRKTYITKEDANMHERPDVNSPTKVVVPKGTVVYFISRYSDTNYNKCEANVGGDTYTGWLHDSMIKEYTPPASGDEPIPQLSLSITVAPQAIISEKTINAVPVSIAVACENGTNECVWYRKDGTSRTEIDRTEPDSVGIHTHVFPSGDTKFGDYECVITAYSLYDSTTITRQVYFSIIKDTSEDNAPDNPSDSSTITISHQPQSKTATIGSNVSFNITTVETDVDFRWDRMPSSYGDSFNAWEPVPNGSNSSDGFSVLIMSPTTAEDYSYKYSCYITSRKDPSVQLRSDIVHLSVPDDLDVAIPSFTIQPEGRYTDKEVGGSCAMYVGITPTDVYIDIEKKSISDTYWVTLPRTRVTPMLGSNWIVLGQLEFEERGCFFRIKATSVTSGISAFSDIFIIEVN